MAGKTLHIFDVAPFCHAGSVNRYARFEQTIEVGSTWRTQVTPAGGVSLIFNQLYYVCNDDCVFCCDRNPTIKKDMQRSYKGNREHKRTIQIQKAVAEYVIDKCGGLVIARAGYEADDIIYSLIQEQHDNYDNIYVYTGDSDLFFLVDNVVSIRPSSTRAKSVDLYNYEDVTGLKYNCTTMSKIIKGDSSDGVPALPKDRQGALAEFFYASDKMFPRLGDKEFVMEWMQTLFPNELSQAEMIFPLDVEDLPKEMRSIDSTMVASFGNAMRNSKFAGMGSPTFDVMPYVKEMQDKGYYMEDDFNG